MTSTPTRFRSKVDVWPIGVMAAGLAVPVVICLTTPAGTMAAVITLLAVTPVIVFIGWIYRTTAYEIDGNRLLVSSGPMHWTVDLTTVRRVSPTRSPFSAPALSFDRLEIRYGRYDTILVSPEDKRGFLRAVAERAPQARFERLDAFR